MATRYGVTWKDQGGKARAAYWAFREGAAAFFAGLCDLEASGGDCTEPCMEYYGPDGERFEAASARHGSPQCARVPHSP